MTTAFGSNVNGVALQPDGKIVAAGGSGDFALVRYNPNGSLDPSFGSGGKVTTDFGEMDLANATDVAIQPDVKIVAAGTAFFGSYSDFALARYNLDGSLDVSFGDGGKVATDFGESAQASGGLVLQADGKIIAAGRASDDFALARYNVDGSLDASFGSGGLVTTDFGMIDFASGVVLQTDGKVVAVGFTGQGGPPGSDFALARYNADGSLDVSFGEGGKVTTSFGAAGEQALDVVLQSDGKIVAVGSGDVDWGLARYNPDGSLDAAFGNGGKVITDVPGGGTAFAVVRQSNGKIVVIGNAFVDSEDFALARYNPNGSLDLTFGNGGIVTTDFGRGEAAHDGVLQADGKIVAAGFKVGGADAGVALARYEGDAVNLPRCQGRPATILGSDGADALLGTPVDDVIIGFKGNDVIDGKGGKDVICGGVGQDTLSGDLGDDSLTGDLGNDMLDGGLGNDVLNGGNGTDVCRNGERLKKCEA